MFNVSRSHLQRYGVSVLSVLLALLLSLPLESLLKLDISPLFFAAVVFSSWYGGLASGLLANVLAVLVNDYFFMPPLYSLELKSGTDLLELVVFSFVALLISSLNAELLTARQRSQANLAKLQVNYRRLLEYRVLLPNGSVRWLHGIGEMALDDWGEPKSVIGIQLCDSFNLARPEKVV